MFVTRLPFFLCLKVLQISTPACICHSALHHTFYCSDCYKFILLNPIASKIVFLWKCHRFNLLTKLLHFKCWHKYIYHNVQWYVVFLVCSLIIAEYSHRICCCVISTSWKCHLSAWLGLPAGSCLNVTYGDMLRFPQVSPQQVQLTISPEQSHNDIISRPQVSYCLLRGYGSK